MRYVGEHHNDENYLKMWSANVVMALLTVIRKTGVGVLKDNIMQIINHYLFLERNLCRFLVSQMEQSIRSVYHIE